MRDGWWMGVVSRDLAVLYGGQSGGEPSPLQEVGIQYADYAAWQRQWLSGQRLAKHLDYWKGRREGELPEIILPRARYAKQPLSHRGAIQTVHLPEGLCDELRTLSRREGVTLYMMLLAAFQTLLHLYTGLTDLVVGSPIANR